LLSQQIVKPQFAKTLLLQEQLGTELILLAGARYVRVQVLRTMLQGRNFYLIPMGGSCWIGNLGFVNAALELAQQVESGEISCPERLYIPLGTMGTATGLALGFALAKLEIELHAVRVTDERVANRRALQRLLHKTATLLHQIDPSIPADLATRTRIVFRDDFVGSGYGHSNAATEQAIAFAHQYLDIELESTYSGKAMAAMLHDIAARRTRAPLFWNTFNNVELSVAPEAVPDFRHVPEAFRRYFDTP
jgi:D-cysteine desulfhydrase